MKLYEVNEEIENIFDQIVDPETGEVLSDSDELMDRLDALQMKRKDILSYLAKLVLNTRSDETALKAEEERLKARREKLERKEESLMKVLDRECGGEKRDLGIATFSYRKTEHVDISDSTAAIEWLLASGHENCCKRQEPEIIKSEVKKLLSAGENVPGTALVQDYSCNLK